MTACRDAATDGNLELASGRSDRTNQNVEIRIASTTQIPHRSTVRTARMRLEQSDRLHRLDFRCSGHTSARKTCLQRIDGVEIYDQISFDDRDEMLDELITLNFTHPTHNNGFVLANTRQVVPHQIDDHDIFRTILFTLQQIGGKPGVNGLIARPRDRSFDRSRLKMPITDFQETFGRRTDHLESAAVVKSREGRRVGPSKPQVERRRVKRRSSDQTLRQVDLKEIAVAYSTHNVGDRRPKLLARKVAKDIVNESLRAGL